MRIKQGTGLILVGLLVFLAGLGLVYYNLHEQNTAAEASGQALAYLETQIEPAAPPAVELPVFESVSASELPAALPEYGEIEIPDYILNPKMEMPVLNYEGLDYIGSLSLPTLGLELPIISQWSEEALKIAPCRYSGSAYQKDLVLMAHNYTSHFRPLLEIREGDPVLFTDVDGNRFTYEVAATETLMPTAIEEMTGGQWDLTLFTCTIGGAYRFTVRCVLTD